MKKLRLAALLLLPFALPARAESWTPAQELLGALDLLSVARSTGPSRAVVALTTKPSSDPYANRGRAILQSELVDSRAMTLDAIELLYDDEGRLIAVFPVIPPSVRGEGPQAPEKWARIRPRYFDVSPFYMQVPRPDDPAGFEKWRAYAPGFARDQKTIKAFLAERFGFLDGVYAEFSRQGRPYRLHEVDAKTGAWDAHGFGPLAFLAPQPGAAPSSDLEPEEFERFYREIKPGKSRAIIPDFPTVYALANMTPDELEYLRLVSKKFKLAPDAKLLVIGPGTGVDTWIASRRTKEPVRVVGINPLEVANTIATARIAGFPVRAIVGDNAADENGKPRFPGETFDAVFWSMPAYWTEPRQPAVATPLTEVWDGDVGGPVLRRLARALPLLLKPSGGALLWNFAPDENGRNPVADILETADGKAKVFDVEIQRFPRPTRKKTPSWYEGLLYTVTRPR